MLNTADQSNKGINPLSINCMREHLVISCPLRMACIGGKKRWSFFLWGYRRISGPQNMLHSQTKLPHRQISLTNLEKNLKWLALFVTLCFQHRIFIKVVQKLNYHAPGRLTVCWSQGKLPVLSASKGFSGGRASNFCNIWARNSASTCMYKRSSAN